MCCIRPHTGLNDHVGLLDLLPPSSHLLLLPPAVDAPHFNQVGTVGDQEGGSGQRELLTWGGEHFQLAEVAWTMYM